MGKSIGLRTLSTGILRGAKDPPRGATSASQSPTAVIQLGLFFEICTLHIILSKNRPDYMKEHLKEKHLVK